MIDGSTSERMTSVSGKVVRKARWFYKGELKDAEVYSRLGSSEKDREKGILLSKLGAMEKSHADFWNYFLRKNGQSGTEYRYPRYKSAFILVLRRLIGLPLVIRLFERGEESVIVEYTNFLNVESLDAEDREKLHSIITDEVLHEEYFASQLSGVSSRLESIRDVFYGMSDGLVEVLAAVAGLVPIVHTPILVAAGGLVVGISGTLSMAIGAYMSTKAHIEIGRRQADRVAREIEFVSHEEKVGRLKAMLDEMGLQGDYTEQAARSMAQNQDAATEFFVRNKLGRSRETDENPRRAGLQTGLFYLIGSAFPILPFAFVGGITGLALSVIAVAAAQTTAATIIALSSDTSVLRKVLETVGLTLGAASATYLLGSIMFALLHLPAVP
jgi:VIT1/CCC1 family predicted Fe2+/Mn2+ transporter